MMVSLHPSYAQIIKVEPVPELMNDVTGELVLCPPVEGLVERSLKLADTFFTKYNFDDDLKEFVSEFINDFEDYGDKDCNPEILTGAELKDRGCGDRTFDEILADPRFDVFAKIVKLYPDYEGKGFYSNLKDIAENFSGSLEIPQCIYDQDAKYVSGGLTIQLEGKKADNNAKSSVYILTSKAADKSSFTLGIPNYSDDDLSLEYGNFLTRNFYEKVRVLKNPLLSLQLDLSDGSNNFLQKKLNIDRSKSTKLRISSHQIPHIVNLKFNTSMFCSEALYMAGYCNLTPPKYSGLYYYNNPYQDYESITDVHDLDNVDYADKKYLNNHHLAFKLVQARLTKSNSGGIPTATVIANAQMTQPGYEGLKVFFRFDFKKGVDLPDANIVDFQEKGMFSDGIIVEASEEEKAPYQDSVFIPSSVSLVNLPNVARGFEISWHLHANSAYRKYSTISQIEIYRNKELITTLGPSVYTTLAHSPSVHTYTYTDSSLTDADFGKFFQYSVVVRDNDGLVKTKNGELYTRPDSPTDANQSRILRYGN